ncbi:MAG: hypothetical protein WBL67_04445 [Nitrososphaeraceae archaeon]
MASRSRLWIARTSLAKASLGCCTIPVLLLKVDSLGDISPPVDVVDEPSLPSVDPPSDDSSVPSVDPPAYMITEAGKINRVNIKSNKKLFIRFNAYALALLCLGSLISLATAFSTPTSIASPTKVAPKNSPITMVFFTLVSYKREMIYKFFRINSNR